MTMLWPTLTVLDVEASIAFYSEWLGFRQDLAEKDETGLTFLGSVEVGETVIMFESPGPNATLAPNHGEGSGVMLTICLSDADDIDALYERLLQGGVRICAPIGDRPWGNRDFMLQDPDGYRISVAKQIAPAT